MLHRRYIVTGVVAVLLLAGCGSVGTRIMPGVATQSLARHTTMASGTYLYVTSAAGGVSILTYPALKSYATISGNFNGGCVDNVRHTVFLNQAYNYVYEPTEYAVSSTDPIAHIVIPSGQAAGPCAIDPTTGNLAVIVNEPKSSKPEYIAVYSGATSGAPQRLRTTNLSYYRGLTYDPSGNLFVAGMVRVSGANGISEIHKGSHHFIALTCKISKCLNGPLQWVGNYLVMVTGSYVDVRLYRMRISGKNATLSGHTVLRRTTNAAYIYQNKVAAILSKTQPVGPGQLGLYQYPKGGQRIKSDWNLPKYDATGVLIAPAQ